MILFCAEVPSCCDNSMKNIILTLVFTLFFSSVALGEPCTNEQSDELIIGVTDISLVNNIALEWFLISNGICSSVNYIEVDLSQRQGASVDLLILADTDYTYAVQTNRILSLSSIVSREELINRYPMEFLMKNEIEMDLYGLPRSISQEFLFWDEVVANALRIPKPETIWTWIDACKILENEMFAYNSNIYGMYGMSHEYLSGFRSDMFDTLLEFFANLGKIDDELI